MSLIILRQNRSKQYKQNFAVSSTSTSIPWKAKFINGHIYFELHRISEQAQQEAKTPRSGRKLSTRTLVSLNAVGLSVHVLHSR